MQVPGGGDTSMFVKDTRREDYTTVRRGNKYLLEYEHQTNLENGETWAGYNCTIRMYDFGGAIHFENSLSPQGTVLKYINMTKGRRP